MDLDQVLVKVGSVLMSFLTFFLYFSNKFSGAGPAARTSAPPGPSHTTNNLSSSYKKILGLF